MKKFLLLSLLILCSLEALTIKLNVAKEKRVYYSMLHILDSRPFVCKKVEETKTLEYICTINATSDIKIAPKKSRLVDIYLKSDNNNTYVIIKPKSNILSYNIEKPLFKTADVFKSDAKRSSHWIFILWDKDIFLKKSKKNGINFPIEFLHAPAPFIGALDLSGTPIEYFNNSKDINAYMAIKSDYDKHRYDFVLAEVNKALENYPHSIFVNDFLLYKLRAIRELLQTSQSTSDNEDVSFEKIIKIGKKWIKRFASDQNIPEVLYYIATAYQNIGQNSDAKYIYDILITEHPDNRWTKLCIISYADFLNKKGKIKKAKKLYGNVLYSTKDIKVASIAADRLAKIYIDEKKYKEAQELYLKILKANAKFYIKDHQKAYKLALDLKNKKLYKASELLLKNLIKILKREPDLKGEAIKTIADIYYKEKDYKEAYKYYNLYAKLFPYGDYIDDVKRSLDEMFFQTDEKNSTKLLAYYDDLIKKYKTGKIYQNAIYLKAKLLSRQKKYKEALDLLEKLHMDKTSKLDIESFKKEVVKKLLHQYLEKEDCANSVELAEKYKIIANKKRDKLLKCYVDTFSYDKAISLAKEMLKDKNTSIEKKLYILDMEAKALKAKKEYKSLLLLADDMINISKSFEKKNFYKNALYYKFFALFGEKKYDDAIKLANKIKENFPKDFKNIDIYYDIVKLAQKRADDILLISYAKPIIKLQKEYKSYVLSPSIEFAYASSLKKLKKYEKALKVLEDLQKVVSKNSTKARVIYEMGDIYLKQGQNKEAKNSFEKCIKLDTKSSWKELCKEGLSIL